jgi:hypothetical protein
MVSFPSSISAQTSCPCDAAITANLHLMLNPSCHTLKGQQEWRLPFSPAWWSGQIV